MDFFDSRYFRVNKFLLSLAGLWPFQSTNTKIVINSISFFGTLMGVIPQIIYCFKHSDNLDEIFESMPLICAHFMIIMKFICLLCNFEKFKVLLLLTQENWSNLPRSQEMQIMIYYAEIGRKFVNIYLCTDHCVLISLPCFALLPLASPVLDIIVPLNETRTRKLFYNAEFFLDSEKYYYTLLLSEYVTYTACGTIILATETIYVFLLMYICGMHAVLCHRLRNLKEHYNFEQDDNDQSYENNAVDYRVQHCTQLDEKIKEYVKIIEAAFATMLFFDITFGIVIYTSSCIMIIIQLGESSEIIRYLAVAIMQSIRFFFVSWFGQELTNHSIAIPIAAYDAIWYFMPVKVQKMLLLIITRGQRPSRIFIAGTYIIGLENFTMIMKTSMSYCTVMISLRKTA